jgi:peroxiredoxin
VPEDRFGDLGAQEPDPSDERSAAEKLAELDERDPEPDDPRRRKQAPPEAARPGGRYMWVVGVAALILAIVVTVHQLNSGTGTFIRGPEPGRQLPEFAAPLVDGPQKDANVVPRSADSDVTKACDVRVPGSINICDLWDKPVVISFLFLRGAECEPQFDRLERVRRRYGDRVNVIGVFFEQDRDRVRDVVDKHDWNFPLAVDRDGAITNLYAVGGCPTTVFAERGGKVRETRTGDLDERELNTLFGRLAR